MRIFTHIYHYIVLVFVLTSVSVMFMLFLQPVEFVEAVAVDLPEGQITGWGWTDTYGWISLNCVNVYAGENLGNLYSHCVNSEWDVLEGNLGVDYGLLINKPAIVEGEPVPNGTINGLAWADNAGWVNFDPNPAEDYIGSFPTTDNNLYNHAVNLQYGNYTLNFSGETKSGWILSGWAVATFDDTDPNNNAWIRFRAGNECVVYTDPSAVNIDNYCVILNENNYLAGWAWSDSKERASGLGWINFQQTFSGGPYVQTKYGDIYSGDAIMGSRAPEGIYNATYCIVSGSSNDITLSSRQACLLSNIDIEFPDLAKKYTTSIVNINLDDLLSKSKQDGEFYLIPIHTSDYDVRSNLRPNSNLDGKTYYFTGEDLENPANTHSVNFTINNSLTIDNGSLGAGTVVVDGDLYINSDIKYGTSSASTLNEIASIAWIVLGDVYIDKSVKEVVGTFIVLGGDRGGTGKFYTGDDTGTPNRFTLGGMVIAKSIVLGRTYFVGLDAAEIFKYDGRVLLNTPPGLGNFSGNLPSWSR